MKSMFGIKSKVELVSAPTLTAEELQQALANEGTGRPLKAVQELLSQLILERTSAAMDETLGDPQTKFYLGGAAALAAFKEELEYLTRSRP